MPPLIVAHRVESSKSFEAAVQAAADGIEFDVRRTKDGHLIVHHDPRVGLLATRNHSLEQLQAEAYRAGYTIRSLPEVIDMARGKFHCDVELKETGYEATVIELVRGSLSDHEFVVLSFHDSSIAAVKMGFRTVRCGLLLGFWRNVLCSPRREFFPIARAKSVGADFLAPHWVLLRFGFHERATNNQLPLRVWTVDRESYIERYSRIDGIEAIITNVPGVARQARGRIA